MNSSFSVLVTLGYDAISLSVSLFLICKDKTWKGIPGKGMTLYYRMITSLSFR